MAATLRPVSIALVLQMLVWSGVRCFRGWVVIDNVHWRYNASYIANNDTLLPRRYHVMPADYYSTGVDGEFNIIEDVACGLQVLASFRPQIMGTFPKTPTLTWAVSIEDFFNQDRKSAVPPLMTHWRESFQECIVPRVESCPFTKGQTFALRNCTLASIMDLPEKIWLMTAQLCDVDGSEIVFVTWQFHLDDTPILRLKRPSLVQRRLRAKQGKKPVLN